MFDHALSLLRLHKGDRGGLPLPHRHSPVTAPPKLMLPIPSRRTRLSTKVRVSKYALEDARLPNPPSTMHYERAPHLGGRGAASAPLRCAGLRSATAARE